MKTGGKEGEELKEDSGRDRGEEEGGRNGRKKGIGKGRERGKKAGKKGEEGGTGMVLGVCESPLIVPFGSPTAHERGQAGGGWSSDDHQTSQTSYKPTTKQWAPTNYPQEYEEEREHLSSTGEDLSRYRQSGIEQEQKLVDDITAPGGFRAAPPRESLNKFITR